MIKNFSDFLKDYKNLFKLIPSLLAICCFINTLSYDFVYDDFFHVVKAGPALGSWDLANLKRLITTDFWTFITYHLPREQQLSSAYYRPFLVFCLKINYLYAGADGWKWHITGILLHAFAASLVYKVVTASLEQINTSKSEREIAWLALISASIFAIHPAQSESIAWISAHANALLSILIFSALLAYLKAKKQSGKGFVGWLLISVVFYSLAIFTKEVALLLPMLLFSYEVFLLDREKPWIERLKEDVICGLPFVLATIGYLAVRFMVLGKIGPVVAKIVDFPTFNGVSFATALATIPTVILSYLKNIVFPFSLSLFYPVNYVYQLELKNFYLPLFLLLVLCLISFILIYRDLIARFGIIWLIVPLLPVMDVRAFRPEELIHDRYLYFSLIGAGLVLGQSFLSLNTWLVMQDNQKTSDQKVLIKPSLIIVIAVIFTLLAATTIKQNSVWTDDWQLWTSIQQNFPTACLANKELGRICIDKKMYSQAITYFEQAKETCPDSLPVHESLGFLYLDNGDFTRAEAEVLRLIELAPNSFILTSAYLNLGFIYKSKGDKTQAIKAYESVLALDPNSKSAKEELQKLK